MNKITYIIPLHEFNKKVEKLYCAAIDSIDKVGNNKENRIMLIGPESVVTKAQAAITPDIEVTTVINIETDFFTQINKAAYQCVTPYFTVIEFDDEVKPYWNNVMQEYLKEGASVLLPINEFRKDKNIVALGNEIAWSSSFANISETGKGLGYIDVDCLNAYMDFNVTGALIKTEDFISLGGLKPSLKIASWYEFLLRAAYNSKFVYVVPKIAYTHTIDREGSYMDKISKEIDSDYGKWLIKSAQEEYFFKNDRNKEYTPASIANN